MIDILSGLGTYISVILDLLGLQTFIDLFPDVTLSSITVGDFFGCLLLTVSAIVVGYLLGKFVFWLFYKLLEVYRGN